MHIAEQLIDERPPNDNVKVHAVSTSALAAVGGLAAATVAAGGAGGTGGGTGWPAASQAQSRVSRSCHPPRGSDTPAESSAW